DMNASLKVAVVTGAGTGIGKASALALARAGWQVAFAGRRQEILDQALAQAAGNGIALATDVTDPDSVKALFAAVKAKWGRVDLLFNNAGGGAPAVPMDELPWEKWKAVVDANLNGSFLCAQAAMAMMKAQSPRGGRIVNNGSISAHAPRPNTAAYTSTKHAITGLTKCISLDGRPFDIACGQIDIGNAATEMTERMTKGIVQASGQVAVEPRMDVEDVAKAVVFMAGLSLDSNVQFMTIMATKMPFVGRG
ncbi:MAG TPA: SDR family oxidoreductase, partial [Usitatibacteraceae bacterium]|nr:SDR family oxidoreductase [Usitatibacteraceae bacterium]